MKYLEKKHNWDIYTKDNDGWTDYSIARDNDDMEIINYFSQKKKLKESEIKKLKLKIDKLHKMKIYHKDLHRCNIMVTKKNGKLDFVILDFRMAVEQKNMIKNLKKNNKGRAFMIYNDEDKGLDKVLYISIYNLLISKKIIVNC